jgi:serine protease Do
MAGIEQLVERLRRSSVQVLNRGGGGSGIVWDSAGRILTNSHVVNGDEAWIVDSTNRKFRARIARRDADRDLALLETDAALESAPIGDSSKLRPGQFVIALGNPLGIAGAATMGAIHSVGALPFGPPGTWLQADIRLAPGNSGGMLADSEGRVIGINSMIFRGLGLAVPSNDATAFLESHKGRARAA